MKGKYLILLILLFPTLIYAQEGGFFTSRSNGFWAPISFAGEFTSHGYYRNKKIIADYAEETQQSTLFSLGGELDFKSYFWHPSFLTLDLGAEYNPIFLRDDYIVAPDFSENQTLHRLNYRTSFFNDKVINFYTKGELSKVQRTRESLTNVVTDKKEFGAGLNFTNKYLPFTLYYGCSESDMQETETGRNTEYDREDLRFYTSKSIYKNDKQEFRYARQNYSHLDFGENYTEISADNFLLSNHFNFDKQQRYSFRSIVNYRDQSGTIQFKRFTADEQILLRLPLEFRFQTNYRYTNFDREHLQSDMHSIRNRLSHQLFQSLYSQVTYEYKTFSQNDFERSNHTIGGGFRYTKRIILQGRLNVNYMYERKNEQNFGTNAIVQIVNEEVHLSDGELVLLANPNVDPETIVIKAVDGAAIYSENIDYILIFRDSYIEIQRLPGGQIPNNTTVHADYGAERPGDYSFDANTHHFSARVQLWGNKFAAYFSLRNQDFVNEINTELTALDYFTETVAGAETDLDFIKAGFEVLSKQSTIIPYRSQRVFINSNFDIKDRFFLFMAADAKNMYFINERFSNRFYTATLGGSYSLTSNVWLNTNISYRKQQGHGIDLNLLTGKLEMKTTIRQLQFSAGLRAYYKDYLGDIYNFQGVYFKLTRHF